MPIPAALAGSIISAGANTGGQILNAVSTGIANKKARRHAEKMYQWQRADSLADWHMQNEYNSPSAQMQRLRDAKLNPNLVYSNGADNTAGVVRSSNPDSWKPQAPQYDVGGIADRSLSTYYDIRLKEAQLNNLESQNTIMIQDAALRNLQVRTGEFDLGLKSALRENSLQVADAALQQQLAQIKKLGIDTQVALNADERATAMMIPNIAEAIERIARMRSQNATDQVTRDQIRANIELAKKDGSLKDIEIKMRQLGLNPSDPAWQRMLAQGVGAIVNSNTGKIIKNNLKSMVTSGVPSYMKNFKPKPNSLAERLKNRGR